MPIQVTSWTGTCGNCGQPWVISYPAFNVYCPRCHARVMRLSLGARLVNAGGAGLVAAIFVGLVSFGLTPLVGPSIGYVGLGLAAVGAIWTVAWTYRSARTNRSVAQPRGTPSGLSTESVSTSSDTTD
jgi:hypothetical protein